MELHGQENLIDVEDVVRAACDEHGPEMVLAITCDWISDQQNNEYADEAFVVAMHTIVEDCLKAAYRLREKFEEQEA